MNDEPESDVQSPVGVMPDSHRRILIIMAALGLIGTIAGAALVSVRFGLGVFVGVGLAFANYYWLKHSLRKVFESAAEGEKPRISMLRYLGRYLALGIVIAIIYASEILPIVPVVLGIAGFGFAVVVDGFIRIFTSFSDRKEI